MRGRVDAQDELFHTFNLEELIPEQHPLRQIKKRADGVLACMSRQFNAAYGRTGRPSIPPERLIKAMLLMALYSIRSERQLCEQISYNLLFRWFLDLKPSEKVWTPEVFSMNRKRFADHGLVQLFFDRVNRQAILEAAAGREEFVVDGTLIESYASLKSIRPIGCEDAKVSDSSEDDDRGNPTIDFRGQRRRNATHRSIVDPEARLARKGDGQPALLSHSLHVLMDPRSGLCMDIAVAEAHGHAERQQALAMLDRVRERHPVRPVRLIADGGYAAGSFLAELERRGIVPYVPIPAGPIRGVDSPDPQKEESARARQKARKRMKTVAYRVAQRLRKQIEEVIGWLKTIAGLARARLVGRWKIELEGYAAAAAYNLLRLARLRPLTARTTG